ncbi:MAG: hypothetical protein HY043_02640 [Verrucomicrobia bacterium]|nr:hypothetical protein [Verrucomicrobiota bacterium]
MVNEISAGREKVFPRRRIVLVTLLGLLLAAPLFGHAFCNWPRHTAAWADARVEKALARGLDYLHASGAFLRPLSRRGAPALQHYLLNQVLEKHDHAGLRVQLGLAARLNQDAGEWRDFYGLRGWASQELEDEDRERIQLRVQNSQRADTALLLHAINPAWTKLSATNESVLFEHPERFTASAELCRALLAYHWLSETSPEVAKLRRVDVLAARVAERLRQLQMRAVLVDGAYYERMAVGLFTKQTGWRSRRWVERILANQASDGGWPATATFGRALLEMAGWHFDSTGSSPESTVYALVALSQYREVSRASAKPAR